MTPRRGLTLLSKTKDIIVQALRGWIEHDASTMGAALAFYTVFSVAPILIIAIGVLDSLTDAHTISAYLLPQMQSLLGNAGASAVQTLLLAQHIWEKAEQRPRSES